MKYVISSLSVVAFAFAAPASDSPPPKPFLAVPMFAPAEERSAAMSALLESWKKEKVLEQVDRWEQLAELPAWAFDPKNRDIGFIPPRPMIVHDYRYAVITNPAGDLLVVRAGGIADTYEIFAQKKAQPNAQLNAGGSPSSNALPASDTPSSPAPRG